MSILTQIERIRTLVESVYSAVQSKGGTIPSSKTLANLPNAVNSISTGIDTSDATATAGDILSGKTAYAKGEKVTGSIGTLEHSATTFTVSTAGVVTAKYTWTAGYSLAGSKSSTKQLTTQAAATITPGTTAKTAVASGRYTTGAVTVAGDANLVGENIKSGTSIFGVNGTYTSDATATADDITSPATAYVDGELITGTMTKVSNYVTFNSGTAAVEGTSLRSSKVADKSYAIKTGASVRVDVPMSSFGNATAADVASGKTFTSSAGLKITGTASGSTTSSTSTFNIYNQLSNTPGTRATIYYYGSAVSGVTSTSVNGGSNTTITAYSGSIIVIKLFSATTNAMVNNSGTVAVVANQIWAVAPIGNNIFINTTGESGS